MKPVKYKKASIYYLVGNLFNKGMSFLTVPIFTRILSTSDYGIVTTYNSWIAIAAMVMGFALHMGVRAAFIDYEDQIDDFMSVTTTFILESGAVFGVFVFGGMIFLKKNIMVVLLLFCFFQGIASALIQNYSMYLMMQYRYKFRTMLMILPGIISTVLSILAILFVVKTDLYMGRIIPTAIVDIVFGIMVIILVYRRSHVFRNKEYLKYGLAISGPLVLHGIALNILSQSDRTMITWLADASQTGIYSLIYNFSMLATVLTTSLEGVWVPWFMNKYKDNKIDEINSFSGNYVYFITYAMVALVLVGPEFVRLLASEKYWEGIRIIPPVVLANYLIFLYTFYVNVEHFHKKTPYITVNTLIAAAINLLLNYIFIPRYGYVAAAYTTLAAYFAAFLLHAAYAKRLAKNLYPFTSFILPLVHIAASMIVFYVFIDKGLIRWAIVFVYICIVLWMNRERIRVRL